MSLPTYLGLILEYVLIGTSFSFTCLEINAYKDFLKASTPYYNASLDPSPAF
jgi:hypothetical protein